MKYQESRRFRRRDNMVLNLKGPDNLNVLVLVDIILNMQDRIQELEFELKNIKHDMKVKEMMPSKMDQKTKLILALMQVENIKKVDCRGTLCWIFTSHLMPIRFELERQLSLLTKRDYYTKIEE